MNEIHQYQTWSVDLNPTKGSEQKGIRPCIVVSPGEMNNNLPTSLIVPLTRTEKNWPTVVKIESTESISGTVSYALVEQLRNVLHQRLLRKTGEINKDEIWRIKDVVRRLLVD